MQQGEKILCLCWEKSRCCSVVVLPKRTKTRSSLAGGGALNFGPDVVMDDDASFGCDGAYKKAT